ncbi:UNVERIFIED_CONTAM: hypothetical protein HDU68_007997 [Siphonaria sp. JEL0065]|nr:hypothetical protein HDU68_007997 [Siphonaria sp. JEL0065]
MSTARRATIYSPGNSDHYDHPVKPVSAQQNPSSLSTLAQSYESIPTNSNKLGSNNSSSNPRIASENQKLSKHWLGAHSDSLYTISTFDSPLQRVQENEDQIARDRIVSIDESEEQDQFVKASSLTKPPKKAGVQTDLKTQISWTAIRASQEEKKKKKPDQQQQQGSSTLVLPKEAREKESEGVGGLKRWHNAVLTVDDNQSGHHRKISGASSEYNNEDSGSSVDSSSNSSNEYDSDRRSAESQDDNDTAISSQYSSTGSTQNDSRSESDNSSHNDSLNSPLFTTAPENLPKEGSWSDTPHNHHHSGHTAHQLKKGDATMPSDLAAVAKTSFKASLPSFEEEEEEEQESSSHVHQKPSGFSIHQQQQHLPQTPQPKEPQARQQLQQQHHGLGHWKLPPLLKKIVYGSQEAAFSTPTTPATPSGGIPSKFVSKPIALPDSRPTSSKNSPSPHLSKSQLPVPVSRSKPSTANNLIHAVKQITSLGTTKNRVGSDPGLAKLSSSLGSSMQISKLEGSHNLGSSKTLASDSRGNFNSTGTIWDNEDKAREAEAKVGMSDEECFIAAKIRFDAKYKIQKQLGAGGHSTVRLATRIYDNKPVVCKFIKQSSVWHWHSDPITGRQHPLEIQVMRTFSHINNGRGHSNLINYYEHFELNGKFMIIMEYMGENWVDLYDYIELYGPVREDVSLEIFKSIVETLVGLHDLGYYHNDIKDENVLINTKTRQIKLIDFGSATPVPLPNDPNPNLCENFYGTKKFAAPEAVQGDPYDPEMQESWALGTLLFVLLFKLDPFTTDEEILGTDINKRIAKFRALAAKNVAQRRAHPQGVDELTGVLGDISDDAVDALVVMMEKDPTRRIKVKDILRLPAVRKARKRVH